MQQLHPKAVWLFFFKFSSIFLIVLIFFGISSFFLLGWGSIVIVLVLFIFFWIWAKLTYRFYRYELSEESFRKELGVILKKYVTIPYERIQNININRGVLDRILGLSSINIFTAGTASMGGRYGGGGAEGQLPGLDKETAEKLREELVKRAKGAKSGL